MAHPKFCTVMLPKHEKCKINAEKKEKVDTYGIYQKKNLSKSIERNSFWLERYYFDPSLDEVDTPKFKDNAWNVIIV